MSIFIKLVNVIQHHLLRRALVPVINVVKMAGLVQSGPISVNYFHNYSKCQPISREYKIEHVIIKPWIKMFSWTILEY